jgi:glycosyltransferase involved in cell wall biosynthesis
MTEAMKSDLKTNFNIDSFLVGNFLDELSVSSFQIAKKDDKEIYFTFVGSLTQRKNVFFLIESFIKFSKNRSDVKLFIVGDGPLKEKVSILIKNHQEKIKYLGFLDSPYELLAKSHVFVLLSSSEGMSRAALEALFLGNIGLLSNVEGNSELIVQGVNGYLFDLNSDDIVKYFEKCYNHVRLTPNSNKSFLPPEFNQKTQTKNLIKLLEYHDKNN